MAGLAGRAGRSLARRLKPETDGHFDLIGRKPQESARLRDVRRPPRIAEFGSESAKNHSANRSDARIEPLAEFGRIARVERSRRGASRHERAHRLLPLPAHGSDVS